MKATVAERGQVTIPKILRKKLGIKAGTALDFREENGRLVAVKIAGADPVARVYGCVKFGKKPMHSCVNCAVTGDYRG